MHPDRASSLLRLASLALLVVAVGQGSAGCADDDPAATPPSAGVDAGSDAGPVVVVPSIASPKANVRFLNAPRLSKTFAKALALPENELCTELGQYQCVDFIHKVSLLGTDPYLFGANEPLKATTASTPLIVERVATAGCLSRYKLDRAQPASGIFFHRLVIDASGKANADAPEVAAALDGIYVRALQRHATATEVADLKQLYRDIEALPSSKPAEDWAIASCVAVLTSMESLFY